MTKLDDLNRCPACRSADIISNYTNVTKWRCMACNKQFNEPWIASKLRPASVPTEEPRLDLKRYADSEG